jgi:hypothetical protein
MTQPTGKLARLVAQSFRATSLLVVGRTLKDEDN